MSDLTTTHRTTVTEDQIDHLGHMNVRFYGVAARAATGQVVANLGGDDRQIRARDLYTRHHHEQLLGASLEVRSGVLGAGHGALRLYHELRNVDTDDLAASFVQSLTASAADGSTTDADWPSPDAVGDSIEIPGYGRPRTIDLDLDPVRSAPDLETARSLELAIRVPRSVTADECEPSGVLRPTEAQMLIWGGEPLPGSAGPMLHDGPDGQKLGWATMEHRVIVNRLPHRGDQIQSFSATLAVGDKTTHRILWAYDLERGDLLIAFEVVDLAFDTIQRRAVSIPDDLRAQAEAVLHPAFASAPPG